MRRNERKGRKEIKIFSSVGNRLEKAFEKEGWVTSRRGKLAKVGKDEYAHRVEWQEGVKVRCRHSLPWRNVNKANTG